MSSLGDRIIETYLREELRVVNKSLPIRRKTLKELLEESVPHVLTRDGGTHIFRKSELRLAYELLGDELSEKLYLPIILEVRSDIEGETVMVVNDDVAITLISKVLGIEKPEKPMYIYPVQLNIIRRKIGTLVQYAFTLRFNATL